MATGRHIACAIAVGCLASAAAHADHHGMTMPAGDGSSDDSTYQASVAVLAATFSPAPSENMFYGGDYEGVVPAVGWAWGRFSAGAAWSYYRLIKNGARELGVGDLGAHGQVTLVSGDDGEAGLAFAASAPTGDEIAGLGMGHPMLMPAAWGVWHHAGIALGGSFGYSRALTGEGHAHGMAPIVDPMNMSELTWSATADVPIAGGVRAGGRLTGGVPVGSMMGTDRLIGVLRVAWREGRVDTAGEVQFGLDGDPFNVRGVLETSLRF